MLIDRGTRYARYVDRERGVIDRRIFADPDIYRVEIERIFARSWLYLAHTSQIPNAGDYVSAFMGEEPVIVTRTNEGTIAAFINSCTHRGNNVCRADLGNTKAFVCPYHGWTFDLKGDLTGVPGQRDLYHGELDRGQWGLTPVAQIDEYRGMIFGVFDPEAPPLEEFLGDMRWGLDLLLDQGDLVAVPGVARWQMDVNWKFASDNAIGDMYHASWTHRSAFLAGHTAGNGTSIAKSPTTSTLDGGFTLITAYGHGLNANFIDRSKFVLDTPLSAWRKDPSVQTRLGALRSKVNRANMLVFPNLFVNSGSREFMLRNPLGPQKMELWKTSLVDKNATPEGRRMAIRASNRHFGPAGMFEQDDGENWDQSTAGARGAVSQRRPLNYAMGLGHGTVVTDGKGPPRIDTLTNEHAQMWMYHAWSEYMDAETWPALRAGHDEPQGTL